MVSTFSFKGIGEVITCSCFFDFWFWYINSEKNKKIKNFSGVIKSINAESIIEFFGYYPKITIKVLDAWSDG